MRCHGPSTASNARKRLIGTNSKSKAAIAGNCWRPKHQSGGNHDGRGSNPAPVVFLPGARTATGPKCAKRRSRFPRMRVGKGPFDAAGMARIWYYLCMEFLRRSKDRPYRLGVLPGTFNPVTVAHLALAEAALTIVDEVVFVLPRQFPHKTYSGAAFE